MEAPPTIDRSLLLEQGPWVKRLARNLVRDPFRADDVAQETLLAALAAPPRDAADARRLVDRGYQLERWTVVDLFPATSHVETVAAFTPAG